MTRRLLATAVLLVVVGSFPSVARAGTYDIVSCDDAPRDENDAWVSETNTAATAEHRSTCPSASGVDNRLVAQDRLASANTPVGGYARWTFTAPAGSSIVRLRYRRYLEKEFSNGFRPALREASGQVIAGETCDLQPGGGTGCVVGSGSGQSESYRDIGGLSTPSISVGWLCTSQGGGETVCPNGYTEHHVETEMYASTVTIDDRNAATLGPPSGSLFAPGARRGVHDATIVARDAGGVQRMRLYVDNRLAAESPERCSPPYTRPAPCPADLGERLIFDTRTVANGVHRAQVGAVDVAGNESRSPIQAFTVDNPPPPSSRSGDSGGGDNSSGGSSGGVGGRSSGGGDSGRPSSPLVGLPDPLLRVRSAVIGHGGVSVAGVVLPGVTGRVVVSYRYRRGRRWATVGATTWVARGHWATSLPLVGALSHVRRIPLAVRYAGSAAYRPVVASPMAWRR